MVKRLTWLLGAALVAGCSSTVPGMATPNPEVAAAAGEWSVQAALAGLPASAVEEPAAVVLVGDLVAATELAGATRPTDPADTDALVQWSMAISNDAGRTGETARVCAPMPQATNASYLLQAAEFEAELGWSVLDVDSFAEVQAPPRPFSVLTGDFSQADLDAAMGPAVDGVWRVGPETDGDVDLSGRTAARPLGETLRLALEGDELAVARTTEPVQAWLAGAPDLAADPTYADVASALDAQDVYAAMIVQPRPDDGAPLAGVSLVAVGLTGSGTDARMVVAFAFADAASAAGSDTALADFLADNPTTTGQPWADVATLDEATVEDAVLTGVLKLGEERSACTAWNAVYLGELIFATR